MKSIIVFCVIILSTGQAAAAIKDCGELKDEIAAKLTAAGISPSVLAIVDKDWVGAGKIVGSCENGTKRIVRVPAARSVARDGQTDIPSLPAVTFAYGVKDCEELKDEIAAKLVSAGVSSFFLSIVDKNWTGAGKILGSCESSTKRIVRTPVVDSASGTEQADAPTVSHAYEDCGKLKDEIAAKLATAGVSQAVLAIVDKDRKGAGKILGSCEDGTKKIVRTPVVDSVFGIEQEDVNRWSANVSSVSLAYGIKDCGDLKDEIAAKLVAAGVSSFRLAIVNKNKTGGGKIVGSCENGTKRIIRRK
ncbi:hypothetical protein H206_00236 [Candidatus Electrothrix aarhusensis]|uniref:Uncharacterized protein n=1 Tax=Candidatus Electrothrix aarhusensis TaxID=1859131 RepID=A0A444J246_9BACT|nr:hypothetical protein H206_00236 [Candidatus Electrothrix aarhusensis]